MIKKITLIGCGNIGNRHLQAITKINQNLEINIVEPNRFAKKTAKKRLEEISFKSNTKNFHWHNSINEKCSNSDLVIIATNSHDRTKLITECLKLENNRFLIEKIVCQSTDEYKSLIRLFQKNKAKGWVNTERRYFNFYMNLKKKLQNDIPVNFFIVGGNFGLGTLAIHFIDLLSWFNENSQIKLNGKYLSQELLPNKRGKNFKEFSGTILGKCGNAMLSLSFLPFEQVPLIIDIMSNNRRIIIDETYERILYAHKIPRSSNFEFENVSDLTTKISKDILFQDSCMLPSLEDSFPAHNELFRIFNKHLSSITGKIIKKCPLT